MKCIIFSTLFLTGCVSISTVKLSSKSYPAKSENCVINVITKKPDKKFKELILLEVDGGENLQDIMPDIKEKACLAGGDAIILNSYEKDVIPMTMSKGGISYTSRTFVSATVIRYITIKKKNLQTEK